MSVEVLLSAPITSDLEGHVLVSLSGDDLTACAFSTDIEGGFAGARIGIRPGLLLPENVPYFAHVVILCDGTSAFEGRLLEPGDVAGWVAELPLDGYYFTALEDQTFDSTATGTVSGGTFLASVVQEACPAIVLGTGEQWDDSQGAHVPANYNAWMPSAIFNQASLGGHPSGYPMDYRVWDGRVLWAVPRIPPRHPDYSIARHDDGLRRKRSAKGCYGRVSVDYTARVSGTATIDAAATSVTVAHGLGTTPTLDEIRITFSQIGAATKAVVQNLTSSSFDVVLDVAPGGSGAAFGWEVQRERVATAATEDLTFTDRMDIARNVRIPNIGELTNPAALAFRDAQLAKRATPSVSTSLARHGGAGLRTATGQETPPYLVRAGAWVWVEGDADLSPIVYTEYDALSRRLRCEIGAVTPGLVTTLRSVRDADAARRAGVRPDTGGRER